MPLDGNGIWQYTGPEFAAPAPDLLNRLAKSTSDQIVANRTHTVQSFVSAAARTAAFPAPHEGAVTWLEDVNRLEVYDGTAWRRVSAGQGFARFASTTAAAVGSAGFNYQFMDVIRDAWGRQPWTLDSVNRAVTITADGLYTLDGNLTMNAAGFVLRICTGTTGPNTITNVLVQGSFNVSDSFSSSVSTTRFLTAGTKLFLQEYNKATQNILADSTTNPSYLGISAL
jgi:hypothetical protein